MKTELVIDVDASRAERWFSELLRRGRDMSVLMRDIGEALTESTYDRFRDGVAPDGTPWVPLRDGSGRTPLLDTGAMRDEISPDHGPYWVEIRAGAKQARWHQEGTGPFVILKARVNHPGLPARPFIGISAEDDALISGLVIQWFDVDV